MVAVQDPEDLGRRIEELRASIVFDDGLTVLSPCAEQHFMLAIAASSRRARTWRWRITS